MTDDAYLRWFRSITHHFPEAARQIAAEIAVMDATAPFVADAYKKTQIGWAEHDGQIVNMTDKELSVEERGEIIDLIVYRASRLAKAQNGSL